MSIAIGPIRALQDGRYKLIDGSEPELYDLHTDPFELSNVISERPQITRSMRDRLLTFSGAAARSFDRPHVPADLRQRLDALGYMSGTSVRSP